ncbi:hypothetical protein AAEO50_19205 [Rossellomorea oryzaecorticis]|uniref:Transposase n=1 Tax=Rossellomorea oryzaecorticis TaxID=1396505 RepID=A0ABU9KG70_9BACI
MQTRDLYQPVEVFFYGKKEWQGDVGLVMHHVDVSLSVVNAYQKMRNEG